jgi:hypothetical protein
LTHVRGQAVHKITPPAYEVGLADEHIEWQLQSHLTADILEVLVPDLYLVLPLSISMRRH